MPLTKPNLTKPKIGGDPDIWGDKLNKNIDLIDSFNKAIVDDGARQDEELSRLENEKINKTDLDTLVKNVVDNYVDTVTKPDLGNHVDTINKPELDRYTETKKSEINNFTEAQKTELDEHEKIKEGEINTHVSNKIGEINSHVESKKVEINDFTEEQKAELDAYEKVKEGQLESFKDEKKVEITSHTDSEIERINATGIDGKVSKYGDTLNGKLLFNGVGDSIEIIDGTTNKPREIFHNSYSRVAIGLDGSDNTLYPIKVMDSDGNNSKKIYHEGFKPNKSDVGLGNVDNTGDSEKNVFSATKFTTSRTINGVEFDGTQNITITADPNEHNHNDIYYVKNEIDDKLSIKADKSYVDTKVAGLVDSAPETLNTLKELSTALGNDPNFATTVTNQIATKASNSIQIIAGNGLSGGGSLTENRIISINPKNESILVDDNSVWVNIVNDFTTGGVNKVASAESIKVLKQLIDTLDGGGATKLLRASEALGEYDYIGNLPSGGISITVGARLFNPTLYLDGVRLEENRYSVEFETGLITLNEPYANYGVVWVVEDQMPYHVTFCFPTMNLLLASEDIKSRIKLGNVIKILGESVEDDGGHYLVKCENTAKLNAVDIGGGKFLNEIPNTKISSIKAQVDKNKSDILLKANLKNQLGVSDFGYNQRSKIIPNIISQPESAGDANTVNNTIAIHMVNGWDKTMFKFDVNIYSYNSKLNSKVTLFGYLYPETNSIENCGCHISGYNSEKINCYWTKHQDTGNPLFYITTDETLDYGSCSVTNLVGGLSAGNPIFGIYYIEGYAGEKIERVLEFNTKNCPIFKDDRGWCKLANGLIVQWGYIGAYEPKPNPGYDGITFPIAFSHVPTVIPAIESESLNDNWYSYAHVCWVADRSTHGFNICYKKTDADSNVVTEAYVGRRLWVAIGY